MFAKKKSALKLFRGAKAFAFHSDIVTIGKVIFFELRIIISHFLSSVIGIGLACFCKRKKAKKSKHSAASTSTCQFDNFTYGANVKPPEVQENDYSSVDDSCNRTPSDGFEIPTKRKYAEATCGYEAKEYHSPKEDLPGQLYDCIEMAPVKHVTNKAATEEFSDDPVYDYVAMPVDGALGFTNQAYDC